jgi:hypothetical protein
MKKKMSVLAILSVAVLLGFTACGGGGGGGTTGPLGVPESTITVQNAPSGSITVLVGEARNTLPTNSFELNTGMMGPAAASVGVNVAPHIRMMWPHGIQTGQRLVQVMVAGQHRFGLVNIPGNGNATINFNALNDVFALPIN